MILTKQELPPIQHVFNVSDLQNFDLIYIYHHMSEGAKVTLKRDSFQLDGNYNYYVYFKGFKVGTVMVSSLFTAIYGSIDSVEAVVSSLTKEKYLPIRALDVVVRQSELKQVS